MELNSQKKTVIKEKSTSKSSDTSWSPQIVCFACNWCTYTGADLAGTSRLKYPPNIRIIRLMCSGRIDPTFILQAFFGGVDGVLIGGCHPGDCHYQTGNLKAQSRITLTRKLLDQFGIEPERLHLEWISASEGVKFAQVVTDFTEKIQSIGPNPIKGNGHIKE